MSWYICVKGVRSCGTGKNIFYVCFDSGDNEK